MPSDDSLELEELLEDLERRIREGETIDLEGLKMRWPQHAARLEEELFLGAPVFLPLELVRSVTPSEEIAARRNKGRARFLELAAASPLPRISPWTRLLASANRVLEDLASILVTRDQAPVYQRTPALALGLVKGGTDVGASDDTPVVQLDPVRSGDRLSLTCVLPRRGMLVVLLRDQEGISCVYPLKPSDVRFQQAGERIQVRGRMTGKAGETQELVVAFTSSPVQAEVLSLGGDALLEHLAALPELRLRRYAFQIEA